MSTKQEEACARETRLRAKYSCTASDNGGWCNGTAVGSRMRCPEVMICKDKSRACNLGFQKGLHEQMCM